jgi:hypothetical protein
VSTVARGSQPCAICIADFGIAAAAIAAAAAAAVSFFQGTLREAVDAGMLVNKASGMHDVPIVLSLAHNVACAMAYLHQVSHMQTLGFRA